VITRIESPCYGCQRQRFSGFTLIEVLLALVVTVMVLLTCGMLYFSIAQAWISHKQGDAELQHEHSVFAFLEQQLAINPTLPSNLPDEVDPVVAWNQLPEASTYDPVYLSWEVETLPVFLKTGDWMDHMAARLYLKYDERDGLSIIWHPEDSRIDRMGMTQYDVKDYVFEFPFGIKLLSLSYAYWDSENQKWDVEPHSKSYNPGEKGVPDALIFEIEGKETIRRTLYIGKESTQNADS